VTINGVGKLFISRNCQVFCESNQDVTDIYYKLYREIIDCSKELSDKAQDFAATFHQLQRMISQMSDHHKRVQSNSQAAAFEQIAKVATSSGIYVKNLGDVIRKGLADYFKYNMDESESFRDLFNQREQLYSAF